MNRKDEKRKAELLQKRYDKQNDYNRVKYDRYTLIIRKDLNIDLKEVAADKGYNSISAYILHLIESDIGR